eukprot:CAMPEP_0194161246 /NCGR_PEP_ID=MMETSP0152-20130528/78833_1 /TAXON_ID=1049557 /ORGANISM="Thalassiothrix antarctica, Strain L6-D1" /LENGTH=1084 /DNA_ID=CAMNT_0038871019 /DNA_START=154 /DNA_END=3405 /DNA_ORIENTATION=-
MRLMEAPLLRQDNDECSIRSYSSVKSNVSNRSNFSNRSSRSIKSNKSNRSHRSNRSSNSKGWNKRSKIRNDDNDDEMSLFSEEESNNGIDINNNNNNSTDNIKDLKGYAFLQDDNNDDYNKNRKFSSKHQQKQQQQHETNKTNGNSKREKSSSFKKLLSTYQDNPKKPTIKKPRKVKKGGGIEWHGFDIKNKESRHRNNSDEGPLALADDLITPKIENDDNQSSYAAATVGVTDKNGGVGLKDGENSRGKRDKGIVGVDGVFDTSGNNRSVSMPVLVEESNLLAPPSPQLKSHSTEDGTPSHSADYEFFKNNSGEGPLLLLRTNSVSAVVSSNDSAGEVSTLSMHDGSSGKNKQTFHHPISPILLPPKYSKKSSSSPMMVEKKEERKAMLGGQQQQSIVSQTKVTNSITPKVRKPTSKDLELFDEEWANFGKRIDEEATIIASGNTDKKNKKKVRNSKFQDRIMITNNNRNNNKPESRSERIIIRDGSNSEKRETTTTKNVNKRHLNSFEEDLYNLLPILDNHCCESSAVGSIDGKDDESSIVASSEYDNNNNNNNNNNEWLFTISDLQDSLVESNIKLPDEFTKAFNRESNMNNDKGPNNNSSTVSSPESPPPPSSPVVVKDDESKTRATTKRETSNSDLSDVDRKKVEEGITMEWFREHQKGFSESNPNNTSSPLTTIFDTKHPHHGEFFVFGSRENDKNKNNSNDGGIFNLNSFLSGNNSMSWFHSRRPSDTAAITTKMTATEMENESDADRNIDTGKHSLKEAVTEDNESTGIEVSPYDCKTPAKKKKFWKVKNIFGKNNKRVKITDTRRSKDKKTGSIEKNNPGENNDKKIDRPFDECDDNNNDSNQNINSIANDDKKVEEDSSSNHHFEFVGTATACLQNNLSNIIVNSSTNSNDKSQVEGQAASTKETKDSASYSKPSMEWFQSFSNGSSEEHGLPSYLPQYLMFVSSKNSNNKEKPKEEQQRGTIAGAGSEKGSESDQQQPPPCGNFLSEKSEWISFVKSLVIELPPPIGKIRLFEKDSNNTNNNMMIQGDNDDNVKQNTTTQETMVTKNISENSLEATPKSLETTPIYFGLDCSW